MTDSIAEKIAQEHPTDTAYRAAEFIETYTGRKFYSLEPSAADVSVIDIAHALSNQCRYSGHTDSFYSTAQHCCILASYVENIMHGSALDCLQILIHDAAEAYLVDLARPIKQHMPEFRKWDKKIQYVVRDWLGLTDIAIPAWQDDLDTRISGAIAGKGPTRRPCSVLHQGEAPLGQLGLQGGAARRKSHEVEIFVRSRPATNEKIHSHSTGEP